MVLDMDYREVAQVMPVPNEDDQHDADSIRLVGLDEFDSIEKLATLRDIELFDGTQRPSLSGGGYTLYCSDLDNKS
jgi:hypothetical protein